MRRTTYHWCAICAAPCSTNSPHQWLNQHRCLETGKKAFLTYQPLPPGKRSIQVHQACLEVLKLIAPPDPSTDIFPITFDDVSTAIDELPSVNARREGEGVTGLDYNLLISWSLPKWAGSFLWSESTPPAPSTSFNVNIRGVKLLGYVKTSTPSVETWRGLSSQRKRWHITRAHLYLYVVLRSCGANQLIACDPV